MHIVKSIISPTFAKTEAISVYLFAIAILLLAVILLLLLHWRHQINQRNQEKKSEISEQKYTEIEDEKDWFPVRNSEMDEVDNRKMLDYPTYQRNYSIDNDVHNLIYQNKVGYKKEYYPIPASPPLLHQNQGNYYSPDKFGEYSQSTIDNRYSKYDNLPNNYLPIYANTNYLKNSDLV